MGMAASQARLIELAARKSNVEYQGQQINQQRMNLANESSSMFTRLMSINVPTPPSSADFTTTVYKFSDGPTEYTIDKISPDATSAQYNSLISYYHNETNYTGLFLEKSNLNISQRTDPSTGALVYYYGTTKLSDYDSARDDAALQQIVANKPESYVAENFSATPQETAQIKSYTSGIQTYYVSLDQFDAGTGATTQPVQSCYATDFTSKVYQTSEAYLQSSDSGRYTNVTLPGYSNSMSLTATTDTNQNAYNDAMNAYEFAQQTYEKQVQDINAKTKVIQQQDRTLELQLKQLDTEQDALSTEMDSVKKVIDKNVEQTFKTFQ